MSWYFDLSPNFSEFAVFDQESLALRAASSTSKLLGQGQFLNAEIRFFQRTFANLVNSQVELQVKLLDKLAVRSEGIARNAKNFDILLLKLRQVCIE